jgi:hypothetical protein
MTFQAKHEYLLSPSPLGGGGCPGRGRRGRRAIRRKAPQTSFLRNTITRQISGATRRVEQLPLPALPGHPLPPRGRGDGKRRHFVWRIINVASSTLDCTRGFLRTRDRFLRTQGGFFRTRDVFFRTRHVFIQTRGGFSPSRSSKARRKAPWLSPRLHKDEDKGATLPRKRHGRQALSMRRFRHYRPDNAAACSICLLSQR